MKDYRIALREDHHGQLDDVVVNDVSMFRAEIMDDRAMFMCCYFGDSDERVAFWVRVAKGKLYFYVTEQPAESRRFVYEWSPAERVAESAGELANAAQVVARHLIAAAVEDKLGRDHGCWDEYPEIGQDDRDAVTVSAGRLAPFPAVDVYEAAYALLEARAQHGAES